MHGVYRGDVQGREWLRCLHVMRRRQVQYSDSRHLRGYMSGLSFLHVLGSREQRAIQLFLPSRLHRAGWHGVHGVYRGDIQGRERIGTVLTVPSGKVLVWDRGGVGGSVHWLSIRFVFTRW